VEGAEVIRNRLGSSASVNPARRPQAAVSMHAMAVGAELVRADVGRADMAHPAGQVLIALAMFQDL